MKAQPEDSTRGGTRIRGRTITRDKTRGRNRTRDRTRIRGRNKGRTREYHQRQKPYDATKSRNRT